MAKWIISALLIASTGLLGGCSSIPLSTMMKFSTFDESDFIGIDPHQLRAKILLEQGFSLSANDSKLAIEIDTLQGRINYRFPLLQEGVKVIEQQASLFSWSKSVSEYQLALTDKGIASFLALQQEIKLNTPKSYSLSVNTRLAQKPAERGEVTMSVLLRFTGNSTYFTLIDNAVLPYGKAD